MKPNELRIGNWVKMDNTNFQLSEEDDFDSFVFHGNIQYLEPIPLTEEWLEKFGFKKHKWIMFDGFTWLPFGNRRFEIFYEKKYGFYHEFYHGRGRNIIKYVHQLQNLYFALTGKELELK